MNGNILYHPVFWNNELSFYGFKIGPQTILSPSLQNWNLFLRLATTDVEIKGNSKESVWVMRSDIKNSKQKFGSFESNLIKNHFCKL